MENEGADHRDPPRTAEAEEGTPTNEQTNEVYEALPGTPAVEMKLFVGRVPRTAGEEDLRPLFEEYGMVLEIAIIKDRNTSQHKGSAFVRMASLTQADAAIRGLNNQKILDPQLGSIQVRYATGELERIGMTQDTPGQDQAKLFVGSLPRTITDDEVRALFSPLGQIDEIFIMKDQNTGQGKGCAFVKFAYKEQAIHAIKTLSGIRQLPGAPRPLEVRFAESKRPSAGAGNQHGHPAVQAGHLPVPMPAGQVPVGGQYVYPPGAYPPALAAYRPGEYICGPSGEYVASYAAYPPMPGVSQVAANHNPRSSGAWKEYFTEDGRAYYHNELTSQTQWDRPPEFDRPDQAGPPGANIFVFHVPNDWTQQDLINNFSGFGPVISARIATDKATGRNRGYAFVSFADIRSSARAVQQMNGFLAGTKRLKVSIKQNEEMYVAHLLNPTGTENPAQSPAPMSPPHQPAYRYTPAMPQPQQTGFAPSRDQPRASQNANRTPDELSDFGPHEEAVCWTLQEIYDQDLVILPPPFDSPQVPTPAELEEAEARRTACRGARRNAFEAAQQAVSDAAFAAANQEAYEIAEQEALLDVLGHQPFAGDQPSYPFESLVKRFIFRDPIDLIS